MGVCWVVGWLVDWLSGLMFGWDFLVWWSRPYYSVLVPMSVFAGRWMRAHRGVFVSLCGVIRAVLLLYSLALGLALFPCALTGPCGFIDRVTSNRSLCLMDCTKSPLQTRTVRGREERREGRYYCTSEEWRETREGERGADTFDCVPSCTGGMRALSQYCISLSSWGFLACAGPR